MKNSSLRDNEDLPVLEYIDSINNNQKITMLEVGSGMCRFVKKIMDLYPNVNITCIEINPDLARIAQDLGCIVINKNILDVKLDNQYDIVHCSHVIEHFGYPEVTNVLEFLTSTLKPDGRLIIRSPLLWDNFFNDIDHIRIYPPESINNYFNNEQQQKKGNAKIKVEKVWYRTNAKQFELLSTWHFAYGLFFCRGMINWFIIKINRIYRSLWARYRWPSTRPNGYVMIVKVLQ